jgi:DNA-binding GntR family transcriptional regulator
MSASPIGRFMLRDQLKELLLARILEGAYAPGARLVETQIADELGVSKAPVREAIRELEILGMVVSEPFRGARVREVTAHELAETYPVRAAIEEVAARAAFSLLHEDVAALETEVEAMTAAAHAGDMHGLLVHDVQFHRLIVEASRNSVVATVWSSLRVEARTLISIIKDDVDLDAIAASHEPVVDAFRKGDAQRAGQVLRQHIEFYSRWVGAEPGGAA